MSKLTGTVRGDGIGRRASGVGADANGAGPSPASSTGPGRSRTAIDAGGNTSPPGTGVEAFGRTTHPEPEAFGASSDRPRPGPPPDKQAPSQDGKAEKGGKADGDDASKGEKPGAEHQPADGNRAGGKPEEAKEGSKNEGDPKKSTARRRIVWVVLGVVLVGGAVGGLFWWLHVRQFETTDDAFIDAHIVPVGPKVAGLVGGVLVDDNQPVNAGDLLAQIDPRDFDIALSNARAGLLAAEGKLAQAEAQVIVDQASAGSARADVIVAEAKAATALSDLKRYRALDPHYLETTAGQRGVGGTDDRRIR